MSSHCAALLLSCASWFLCRLLSQCPLVLSLCCPLVLSSSSDCAALSLSHLTGWLLRRLLLHRPLIVLSLRRSHRLAPASCCIASRPAALSSCRPLVLSLSSHCATLSLSHLTGWLLRRLSSRRPLVVLLLLRSFVVLRQLVVASPLVAPPSSPLIVLYLKLVEPGFLDPFDAIFIRNCLPDCRKG
jgi:hypothetical protein